MKRSPDSSTLSDSLYRLLLYIAISSQSPNWSLWCGDFFEAFSIGKPISGPKKTAMKVVLGNMLWQKFEEANCNYLPWLHHIRPCNWAVAQQKHDFFQCFSSHDIFHIFLYIEIFKNKHMLIFLFFSTAKLNIFQSKNVERSGYKKSLREKSVFPFFSGFFA